MVTVIYFNYVNIKIKGDFMSNFIPLSRYDADVNTIANYQIVPFDWVMKDGAFVMRIIELLELNKLKFFIEEFNKLTGYDVDLHHAKEE